MNGKSSSLTYRRPLYKAFYLINNNNKNNNNNYGDNKEQRYNIYMYVQLYELCTTLCYFGKFELMIQP